MEVTREQVLAFRAAAHGLGDAVAAPRDPLDVRVLDLGVQDTGSDGARWALALRGADPGAGLDPEHLVLVWSLRGAPHVYRRTDAAAVATATEPYDEADAGKRIVDAGKPLREAGLTVLEGLEVVASTMREIVTGPTVKGDLSRELSARLPAPYLRECRPCRAVHTYEQPFRLSALPAGLELEPGTSPPVVRRIPAWSGPAARVPARLDAVRALLRVNGPMTSSQVAGYLDGTQKAVKAHAATLDDLRDVTVADDPEGPRAVRWLAAADEDLLADAPRPRGVRLLGPFDPLLQSRDRALLLPDEAARKDLWRVLGRPGAIWYDGELVGSWRPRASGRRLALAVTLWRGGGPTGELATGVDEAGEQLATVRGQTWAGLV